MANESSDAIVKDDFEGDRAVRGRITDVRILNNQHGDYLALAGKFWLVDTDSGEFLKESEVCFPPGNYAQAVFPSRWEERDSDEPLDVEFSMELTEAPEDVPADETWDLVDSAGTIKQGLNASADVESPEDLNLDA